MTCEPVLLPGKISNPNKSVWRAAIELQRSYQHLRDYLRRQERYARDGVQCFWLVREAVYSALANSIAQRRLKGEFGGKVPPDGFYPALRELPWAIYRPESDQLQVAGNPAFTLASFLEAVVMDRLVFDGKMPFPHRATIPSTRQYASSLRRAKVTRSSAQR